MSSDTYSSKAKFIIDLNKEQAFNEKEIELSKKNNDLYFQINDSKLKLEPLEYKSFYSLSNEIKNSLIVKSNEGSFLLHFENESGLNELKDWIETSLKRTVEWYHALALDVLSIFNYETSKIYLDKKVKLIKEKNEEYFEVDDRRLKIEAMNNKKLYDVKKDTEPAAIINTNEGKLLICFKDNTSFTDCLEWLEFYSGCC